MHDIQNNLHVYQIDETTLLKLFTLRRRNNIEAINSDYLGFTSILVL